MTIVTVYSIKHLIGGRNEGGRWEGGGAGGGRRGGLGVDSDWHLEPSALAATRLILPVFCHLF